MFSVEYGHLDFVCFALYVTRGISEMSSLLPYFLGRLCEFEYLGNAEPAV
jgi:hypothetical protein